jgi:uracil-DNA glycosylase
VSDALEALLAAIRACRHCELPHPPRPVVRARAEAPILICGQAPGRRVHESGLPWDDPSGDRLRHWMGLDRAAFYDERRVAVAAMGFCYPGTVNGADLPPRTECAPRWRARLLALLPGVRLTLLVGGYAQAWHLRERAKPTLTDTVAAWREYGPAVFPLPHPSWRNSGWLKRRPWFEAELVPALRARVRAALAGRSSA